MDPVTPTASPHALRESFLAMRDGVAAQGGDVRAQDAEIALRDAVGAERGDALLGWTAGSLADIPHGAWYPSLEVAKQAELYWAAEAGRGGVAHPPGSVSWPATAWRTGAPASTPAPAPGQVAAQGARGDIPWLALGLGALAVTGVGWWMSRRSG